MMQEFSRYLSRGVSPSKEDVHNAIKNIDKGIFPKSFCKIIPDVFENNPQYCVIMHADGAGTKSSLAYLYQKITGDDSVWAGIAQDSIVMNTDDLACVGAIDNLILSSTIGRNKMLISGDIISKIINGTETFIKQLNSFGINIITSGGETADVGDLVRTIIVDSTLVCRMPRDLVITNENIAHGDVIIGLASFGKSNYEEEFNSGIGSNGLTAARHELLHHSYFNYKETFDPNIDEKLVYSGNLKLTDEISSNLNDVGKLLLSPTRTYLPVLKKIFEKYRSNIHGMIHCTGGGQTKILNFVDELHIVKDQLFEVPEVFKLIQAQSQMPWHEMYQVFNMGHRMELILEEKHAQGIIEIIQSFGIQAKIIGYCEKHATKKLTIKSCYGEFNYL